MEIIVDNKHLNVEWCGQVAFKGDSTLILSLKQKMDVDTIISRINGDDTLIFGGIEPDKVINLVKKYKELKVCAFFDEFQIGNARATYLVYSEAGKNKFTKCIYIGNCDGQSDCPFSETVNILQDKPKKYSDTMTSSGNKTSISYSFPFKLDWNDICTDEFELYGSKLIKCKSNKADIVIPEGVERIGTKAFEGNKTIKKVTIPKTVKVIDTFAFRNCKNLVEISFSKGLEFICDKAFDGCENLIEVVLPDSLSKTSITEHNSIYKASGVFSNCKNLRRFHFSEKLKIIPNGYFENCESLVDVELPKGLTIIEQRAFFGCKSLKQLDLPVGLKKISTTSILGLSFCNCSSLTKVIVPNTVNKIANDTFKGCDNLVLYINKGSYVEEFAKKSGIKYEFIDK